MTSAIATKTGHSLDRLAEILQDIENSTHILDLVLPIRTWLPSPGQFADAETHVFKFDESGITYLSARTDGDPHKYLRLLKEERYQELVETVNYDARQAGVIGTPLRAAMVGMYIVGVMKNYTPVDHARILNAIRTSHLEAYVKYFRFSSMQLEIYLRMSLTPKNGVSLLITNGHSGHVAFGYRAVFNADSFDSGLEFDLPLVKRIRHLSSVPSTVEDLENLVGIVGEMQVDEILKSIPTSRAFEIMEDAADSKSLSSRTLNLFHTAKSMKLDNAFEVVAILGEHGQTKGYKTAARTLIGFIMEYVNDVLTTKGD